jgi:acyl carrier protein
LEQALNGRTLDFALLMSSMSAVLGGVGQSPYAAANLFLDAFAHSRHSSALPWLSVDWDVWRVHDDGATARMAGGTLQDLGMNVDEATRMLETVLRLGHARQLIVSTGDLKSRIDQWIRLPPVDTNPSSVRRSAAAPPVALTGVDAIDVPRSELETVIADVWCRVLGIARVGLQDDFARLGGHSLLAIRIVTELRALYRIDLPVRALFEAPTVAQLAQYITRQIECEIEALSEDEAQRLVRA